MSQHRGRSLPAFLLAALVGALSPATAGAASSPVPDQVGPGRGMLIAAAQAAHALPHDARPFTPGAPLAQSGTRAQTPRTAQTTTSRPRPQVFGYANAGNLGDAGSGSGTWRYQDLTTVAFFGLHVNSNGSLANDGGMNVWNSQDLTNLINAAHPAGVKVVVSLIQQNNPAGSLCGALSAGSISTTVSAAVAQVKAKGVDGVNLDYEGPDASCSTGTQASGLVSLASSLRSALNSQAPGRNNLTIATYASSAYFPGGFFDIPGLAPSVDQFFVMAYDLDNGNWSAAPLNCTRYCFNPVGPLSGYSWTDERAVSTYTAVVPASQVILGVPYYGWYACAGTSTPGSNAYPQNCPGTSSPSWVNPSYLTSLSVPGTPGVSQYSSHTDAHDSTEHYATWFSSSYNAYREMYIDDPSSLGAKYDLVTSSGIAGAGLFALDYGGGDAGIWGSIEYHLTCPVSLTFPSSLSSTRFQVTMVTVAGCAQSLDLEEFDVTLDEGWFDVGNGISPSSPAVTVDTYPGHTYLFRARAHDVHGRTDDWTPEPPTVSVPSGTPLAHPFSGLYTLDDWGGVHSVDSAPLVATGYWPNWDIARAAAQLPRGGAGGYVLDGWGGLHQYGSAAVPVTSGFWNGWDIARDVQLLPDGSGGYVLDGWGGLHPFAVGSNPMPPAAQLSGYWKGWDIAKRFVILPDGSGGYILDGWGGLHSFAIGTNAMPAQPQLSAFWQGWNIARGVALLPGTHTGYVLDGWGGLHPFNGAPAAQDSSYWKGWDIARGLWITSVSGQVEGYVVDGWGGVHQVNSTPPASYFTYWPGSDIAKDIAGS